MKKILFVCNYKLGRGGISGQVEIQSRLLAEEGFITKIFSTQGTVFTRLKLYHQLRKVVRQYDVLHVHGCSHFGFLPIFFSVLYGKRAGKRVLVTYHGGGAETFFKSWHWLVRKTLLRADKNIVLSGFLGKIFEEHHIPYEMIPNVLEFDQTRFRERITLSPNFISIRTLSPLYNIECLLRAFMKVKKAIPEATLTIVGDGPSRALLENMVREHQMKDVSFMGRVDNTQIYEYLDKADIMVSTPRIDNMPMSLLEAFNAGLLVISSRVGGVPYMIEDGVNGVLFESDDDEKLAEQMCWAVTHPTETTHMIKNAHDSLDMYGWKQVGPQLKRVYYS